MKTYNFKIIPYDPIRLKKDSFQLSLNDNCANIFDKAITYLRESADEFFYINEIISFQFEIECGNIKKLCFIEYVYCHRFGESWILEEVNI